MTQILVPNFIAFTIGIMVFFLGMTVNRQVSFLRHYNIPEPVTGGLIAAALAFFVYLAGIELSYELEIRDYLLVYFFTAIGLNARLSDLISGGKPLAILLVLTLSYIVIQNIVGIVGANLVGAPNPVGVLAGSTSLIGGHGTTIAWAPEVVKLGVHNALEMAGKYEDTLTIKYSDL